MPIGVDRNGNINMEELKQKAQDNKNECAPPHTQLLYAVLLAMSAWKILFV